MKFEWDPAKNRVNRQKHRVNFETARQVFDDPHVVFIADDHSSDERWLAIGAIDNVVLVVVHEEFIQDPEAGDEVVRIISARKATSHERKAYEEGDF